MKKFLLAIAASLTISVSALMVVPIALSFGHAKLDADTEMEAKPLSADKNASPFEAPMTVYTIPLDSVVRIRCPSDNPKYVLRGTAEVINGNTLFTASHVVNRRKECTLDDGSNIPATVVYDREDLDYATLFADTGSKQRIPVDCGGFIPGHVYMLVGYAHGRDFVVQSAVATNEFSDRADAETGRPFKHVRTLRGLVDRATAIGGMSGGPIFDLKGNMVGTTVATIRKANSPFAFAREMKDTYVCDKHTTPPLQDQ